MEPLAQIRTYNELVEAFAARKAALGLSDAWMEDVGNLTAGHVTKALGPARSKGIGPVLFEVFSLLLAVDFVMVESVEKAEQMADLWERRREGSISVDPNRLALTTVKRAKPRVMAMVGADGGRARWKDVPEAERRIAMAALSERRWGKGRR